MKNKIFNLLAVVSLMNIISACTAADFRKASGISRPAPDEFLVIPRDKLKVPEAGAAALPVPGQEKDGAIVASDNGREALYGVSAGKADIARKNSAIENAVLARTSADKADPGIRETVNKEFKEQTGVFGTERGGTLEAILDPIGYNSPADPVVNAKAENQRIKSDIASGKKVSADDVQKIDPRKQSEELKARKKNEKELQDNILLNQPKKKHEVEVDDQDEEEPELH